MRTMKKVSPDCYRFRRFTACQQDADATFTPDTFDDKYLHKNIAMQRGASMDTEPQIGKVLTKRLRDAEGRPIGTAHDNPLLDTR